MFAELEGLLLDPVYSGKGAAGLIDYCRKGHFKKGEKVVFLHTGGNVSMNIYRISCLEYFGIDASADVPSFLGCTSWIQQGVQVIILT